MDISEAERKRVEKQIEVMKAFLDGKQILYKPKFDDESDFKECTLPPDWNWEEFDYKVVNSVEYRPYKNSSEFIGDLQLHHGNFPCICEKKVNDPSERHFYSGFAVCSTGVVLTAGLQCSFKALFENWMWYNGSPCGIKI